MIVLTVEQKIDMLINAVSEWQKEEEYLFEVFNIGINFINFKGIDDVEGTEALFRLEYHENKGYFDLTIIDEYNNDLRPYDKFSLAEFMSFYL